MLFLDLDELDILEENLFLFSKNKRNVFSFYDKDHFKFLEASSEVEDKISREKVNYSKEKYKNKSTKERISLLIKEQGLDFDLGKIFILTNLRNFGYLFNPVSFYYCYDKDGKLRALFSEVNNTFHDQKMYYIDLENQSGEIYKTSTKKNYYISPFTDLGNTLAWEFNKPADTLLMKIDSIKDGEAELKTVFTTSKSPLSNYSLLYLQLRYPLVTLVAMFRIHYQAMKLWYKKVSFNRKKEADEKIIKNMDL